MERPIVIYVIVSLVFVVGTLGYLGIGPERTRRQLVLKLFGCTLAIIAYACFVKYLDYY